MKRHQWSKEDGDQLRRLVRAGHDDGAIGRQMNRDRWLIGRKRRAMGLEPGQTPIQTMMMCRLRTRMNYREYLLTLQSLSLS